MPIKLTPQEFAAKWRQTSLKERSAAQEHFINLCQLVGHETPAEADPTGESFTFEAGAKIKAEGGGMKDEKRKEISSFRLHPSSFRRGWADVWKKGYFAWEYKGKHADLDKAYQQLLQYREALQNPPLLVVSDIDSIVIHTNFTNTIKRVERLTLDDLLTPAGMARLRAVFYEPDFFKVAQTTAQVTQEAAKEFARLAEMLRKYGEDSHQIAHFLIRLLFCLFAEDIGLLPERIFNRLVTQTRRNSAAFTAQLRHLFGAMAGGGWFGTEQIAHFDGGLFDNEVVLPLDSDSMDILVKVADLDWSSIEPSILGTLFERSLDPSKRAQLGAHYTSKEDILLIVEPVLMAPLRRRWGEVKAEAEAKAEAKAQTKDRGQRTKLENELRRLLTGFAGEIAEVKVLDPACGSGNFLYVALKQLLDLEKEVVTLAGDLGVGRFFPAVSPAQLYGIEINPYAHELAQATVWIGYIQWLRDNGFGDPSEPILKPLHNIVQMDAVLTYDEQGQPVEPTWPEADVIIGNPPFLGGGKIRSELGNKTTEAIFKLYSNRLPNFSDLCCYWFEKARGMIELGNVERAGLLATNSIRGGANRRVLERIKETGDIFMAWSDRDWILEGAAVNVSMIGFDNGKEVERALDGQPVSNINPDLTTAFDLTIANVLPENTRICFMGASPKAPFDIDADLATQMLNAPLNVNGRPNSDVVRPVASGIDIVQRSRQKWTIDFGVMSENEASLYEMPFEYIKKEVYPIRSQNRRAAYAKRWWQYAEVRPGMRAALQDKIRFIATPEVAKHRLFMWMKPEVLCNQQTLVFARDDDYFFGILHSKPHELWALRMGTSLEDRPRYTPTTTFETFPFPWPPGQEPKDDPRVEAVAQAARELVQKRDSWLNPPDASEAELKKRTLTNLYNERPTWLDLAHQKLDRAVFDAYGWPYDPSPGSGQGLSDEEILARLLALNLERAGVEKQT